MIRFLDVLSVGAALSVFVTVLYVMAMGYRMYTKRSLNAIMKTHKVIPMVHFREKKDVLAILIYNKQEKLIDLNKYIEFVKAYEMITRENKVNADITIVMHSVGGVLSCCEAIANVILNHREIGKVTCVIPYYAYSGGFFISLCCDEIVMHRNAFISPCDLQETVAGAGKFSAACILYTVDKKEGSDECVSEEWRASEYNVRLGQQRQKEFMDKIVAKGKYNRRMADKIYNKFFTGTYNHDHVFSAEDLITHGINVRIVDTMPDYVKEFIDE